MLRKTRTLLNLDVEKEEKPWLEQMQRLELEFLVLCKLDLECLDRKFVYIKKEGKPFRVRVIVYDKTPNEHKRTLVLTHGFIGSSLNWTWMIAPLAKLYRIVLFDNCSWGLNQRIDKSAGIESP